MPWTLAHPAAVLPLRRFGHRLPLAGLVIGSMSPDFGYYTGHFDFAKAAHTPLGILLHCLPIAMLLVLLLRWLRQPLIAILPQPHRAALGSLPAPVGLPGVREALALALAVIVGAATHVAWDSLTHNHGFVVQHWPLMQRLLFRIGGHSFHVYNTLQHASTVIGVACLLVAYRRWLRRTPAARDFRCDGRDRARYALLLACLAGAVAVAVPLAMSVAGKLSGPYSLNVLIVRSVIYATSGAVVALVLAALWWSRRSRVA